MSDMLSGITLEQLLAELGAGDPGTEYRTAREWAQVLRCGSGKAHQVLAMAKAAGKLRTTRVFREALDGSRRSVPVYAIDLH